MLTYDQITTADMESASVAQLKAELEQTKQYLQRANEQCLYLEKQRIFHDQEYDEEDPPEYNAYSSQALALRDLTNEVTSLKGAAEASKSLFAYPMN
jgi:hypothetical protein